MNNLVSIIILTYNNFNYLFECLESVYTQSYNNIQLIISDDSSINFPKTLIENNIIDKSGNNIVKYCILQNDVNLGTVQNLNNALEFAEGDYIIPLASDDVFFDNQVVANFVDSFKSIDNDVLIITSQVENFDQNLHEHISFSISDRQKLLLLNQQDLFYELAKNCFIPSGGTAYRKEYFNKYGKFDERYRLIEDWPTFLKISKKGERISFSDFISVKHRSGGVSNIKKNNSTSRIYHEDLIKTMDLEIIPYIHLLSRYERRYIKKLCIDKKNIYKFRYEFKCYDFARKIKFVTINYFFFPLLVRKLFRRFNINE